MLVRELMTKDVVTIRPEASIVDAARLLLDRDVTAAPVVQENGDLIGIVSRRDLIREREIEDPRAHLRPIHDTQPPTTHLVRQVMTASLATLRPDDDTAAAAALMVDRGVASLPVTDGLRLVGMISVTDLLRTHTHSDDEIAELLRRRFFEYGESHRLGDAHVEDGVVTVSGTADRLATVIAEAVAETTEGVVAVKTAKATAADDPR